MRVAGPLSKRPRISSIGGFLGLYNWLEPEMDYGALDCYLSNLTSVHLT